MAFKFYYHPALNLILDQREAIQIDPRMVDQLQVPPSVINARGFYVIQDIELPPKTRVQFYQEGFPTEMAPPYTRNITVVDMFQDGIDPITGEFKTKEQFETEYLATLLTNKKTELYASVDRQKADLLAQPVDIDGNMIIPTDRQTILQNAITANYRLANSDSTPIDVVFEGGIVESLTPSDYNSFADVVFTRVNTVEVAAAAVTLQISQLTNIDDAENFDPTIPMENDGPFTQVFFSNLAGRMINKFDFTLIDSGVIVAIGSKIISSATQLGTIWTSTDYGATWNEYLIEESDLFDVFNAVNGTTITSMAFHDSSLYVAVNGIRNDNSNRKAVIFSFNVLDGAPFYTVFDPETNVVGSPLEGVVDRIEAMRYSSYYGGIVFTGCIKNEFTIDEVPGNIHDTFYIGLFRPNTGEFSYAFHSQTNFPNIIFYLDYRGNDIHANSTTGAITVVGGRNDNNTAPFLLKTLSEVDFAGIDPLPGYNLTFDTTGQDRAYLRIEEADSAIPKYTLAARDSFREYGFIAADAPSSIFQFTNDPPNDALFTVHPVDGTIYGLLCNSNGGGDLQFGTFNQSYSNSPDDFTEIHNFGVNKIPTAIFGKQYIHPTLGNVYGIFVGVYDNVADRPRGYIYNIPEIV